MSRAKKTTSSVECRAPDSGTHASHTRFDHNAQLTALKLRVRILNTPGYLCCDAGPLLQPRRLPIDGAGKSTHLDSSPRIRTD